MDFISDIPMDFRLAALFVFGACAGSWANLGIYRLAWRQRAISPLSSGDPRAPRRRWSDRLPIVGWLGLRREAAVHGTGFWIRPMLLEIATGIAFAWLYWWEIGRAGLLPEGIPEPLPRVWLAVLHQQYVAHLLLFWLMLVGSLIDADEKLIPDSITVPGTWLGLAIAAAFPHSLLPIVGLHDTTLVLGSLGLTSPLPWPDWLGHVDGLVLALACWWLWCVALTPRSWYSRHGWSRAVQLCWARLIREQATYRILIMGAIGSAAIAALWLRGGGGWTGLLTALVGMAGGGLIVWLVRVTGTAALGREAMGFGDVTLMAMVGAFLGWQCCLVIFFLAPFAALVVGLVQLIVRRDHEIPYGPFLCLAACGVIVRWQAVWDRAKEFFVLGRIVPMVMLFCLVLLAALLGIMRLGRRIFR